MSERSRPYHHGDLRAALVAEALELARTDLAALSLREVTRRAGVSPAAAYRHFRDRSALLGALATEIQLRMVERMQARTEDPGPTDPARRALLRLRGVGLGYIDFAIEEPGWFELAFFGTSERGGRRPGRADPADPAAADRSSTTNAPRGTSDDASAEASLEQASPFAELLAALDDCAASGALPADRRAGAEFSCWSAVHGCAELMVHGPLRDAPLHVVREVAERVVDDIIVGIR